MTRALSIALALALVPRSIAAHPINTALSVVSDRAIRVGHGMVTLDERGRWRFVCPTAWGGPIAPLALALGDGDTMLVVGDRGAVEMTIDGIVTPRLENVVAMHTAELERAGPLVLSLSRDLRGSVIAAFEPNSARELLVTERRLQSIEGTDEGFVVTSSAADGVHLTEYRLDGSELRSSTLRYAEIRTATVGIERAGGELYALIAHPNEYRLAKIEGDRMRLIATSPFPILGPVAAGDEIWFIEDGALLRIREGDVEVVDQSRLYSCLEEEAGTIRACIDTQIYLMRPGAEPELFFDLAEVKGPRLSSFNPDDRVTCEFEWNIFAGEAGLDPTIPEDEEPPDTGCDCTTAASADRIEIALLLAALVCLRACRQRSRRVVNLPDR